MARSAQISVPTEDALEHSLRRTTLAAGLTALSYYAAAEVGEALAFPSAPVSALWAPNAILFAALLLTPLRYWWIQFAAVLPAHFIAQVPNEALSQVAIQYVVNCLEAQLGALALVRYHEPPFRFDRLRVAGNLVIFGAVLAPLATSVVMAAAFVVVGLAENFWLTTAARTLTNTFAILTLVPLILHAPAGFHAIKAAVSWRRTAEVALLAAALIAIGVYVFVLPKAGPGQSAALLYAPLPLLLWATVRFGTIGVCASVLLLGAVSTWGVLHGSGPFSHQDPVENALSLVCFLVVTCIPLLLLAALLKEHDETVHALVASEARYRKTNELHRAVLASLEDQIAVLDNEGVVLEVNDSWRREVLRSQGTRDGVLPGRNYGDALREEANGGSGFAGELSDALQAVLSGAAPRRRLEYEVRHTGEPRWIEQSIESLQRPEGGAVVTLTDVSARKRAELEAQEQYQQLAHLARAAVLGELSGAIAHEISQPLSAILGNAQAGVRLLAAKPVNLNSVREILGDIVADDLRAAEVMKRVRALLRNGEMHREQQDLNDLTSDMLRLMQTELARRGVKVETQLDPRLESVEGDRVQLQQVILNLIVNACEAMNDAPMDARLLRIVTRPGPRPGEIELAISDRGTGIPPGQRERIFQPFITTKPNGLGLGLAICRSIVRAHGGRLWAETAECGAVFRLTLRASDLLTPATPQPAAREQPDRGGRAEH